MNPSADHGSGGVRVAVVGCGPIGELHAAAVADSPHAELVAVCDVDAGRAQALGRRHGACVFDDSRRLLAEVPLDAITVATPDHLHVEVARPALTAGKHVFCEKPLATQLEAARELVALAAGAGVQLGVNYNRRFGFAYRKARELIAAGEIGTVNHFALHVLDCTLPRDRVRGPEAMLTALLTHHLDLARYFAGEVAAVSATLAEAATPGLRRDMAIGLRFREGAIGAIVAGYRDQQTRTWERMEISGSRAVVCAEDVTRRVTLWRSDPDQGESFVLSSSADEAEFYGTLRLHLQAFLASLATAQVIPVTGMDGLRSLELIEAVLRSDRQRREVEVSEVAAG